MLTQAELKKALHYDPETGVFTRLRSWGTGKAGTPVTCITDGYVVVGVGGKQHRACRLAFLYMTGAFPIGQVDHINRNRSDDRWCNLRAVTHAENQQNCSPIRKNNRSGFKGVSWCSRRRRWQAHIQANGKQKNLGVFKTIEEAVAAYRAAEKMLHITKGE